VHFKLINIPFHPILFSAETNYAALILLMKKM